MSSRKRPLAELPPNIHVPTPSRYAPSTPHAIRALQQQQQQQSAVKTTRSARRTAHRVNKDAVVRPDSARAILRRLAKITAPSTRRLTRTPADDQGADEPTNTFRWIDAGRNREAANEARHTAKSRVSLFSQDQRAQIDDDVDDLTILTERGRRAVSEEPTGRLSRYSFGSLHMADIWMEMDRREQDNLKARARLSEGPSMLDREVASEPVVLPDDETQHLRQLRHSSSAEPEQADFVMPGVDGDTDLVMPGMDGDTFQLDMPQDEAAEASVHQTRQEIAVPSPRTSAQDEEAEASVHKTRQEAAVPSPPASAQDPAGLAQDSAEADRQLTELESAALMAGTTRRRKRVKMTKNGQVVPSLPVGLIKHIATEVQLRNGRRRPKLGKDQVAALEQATEWFFEQAGEDLAAYAEHSRRKKQIDQADVLMLMRRQRVLKQAGQLQALAKEWLPKKVLDELDL
ncbi:hypothetical protein DV737_g954, partial [Chaetothyriales sp. CBS 132003]